MVQIVVTTCPAYAHLLVDFDYLFQRFWGGPYLVIGDKERKDYVENLIDGLTKLDCRFIILLHEDFYITDQVNTNTIGFLLDYAEKYGVKRVSLQCVADGYIDHVSATNYPALYRVNEGFQYLCSLEASIWDREFLISILKPGEDVWQTELNCSTRNSKLHVIVPKSRTIHYSDARIHNEVRIKLIDNVFHKLVQGPDGKNLWRSLCIVRD